MLRSRMTPDHDCLCGVCPPCRRSLREIGLEFIPSGAKDLSHPRPRTRKSVIDPQESLRDIEREMDRQLDAELAALATASFAAELRAEVLHTPETPTTVPHNDAPLSRPAKKTTKKTATKSKRPKKQDVPAEKAPPKKRTPAKKAPKPPPKPVEAPEPSTRSPEPPKPIETPIATTVEEIVGVAAKSVVDIAPEPAVPVLEAATTTALPTEDAIAEVTTVVIESATPRPRRKPVTRIKPLRRTQGVTPASKAPVPPAPVKKPGKPSNSKQTIDKKPVVRRGFPRRRAGLTLQVTSTEDMAHKIAVVVARRPELRERSTSTLYRHTRRLDRTLVDGHWFHPLPTLVHGTANAAIGYGCCCVECRGYTRADSAARRKKKREARGG
jgi:hypothetical protein